jgi:TonB-linked SusC/RagA family outer membrane protein
VKLSNAKVEKLFSEIEKKSDFVILYKKGIVENKTVSVDSKNESIEDIFNRILPPLNLSYHINGKQIVVVENKTIRDVKEIEQAPTITASGTIIDTKGEPLPGVSVVEKGKATNGTMTDIDGRFSLKVSPGATLEVSYVGFVKQEVKAGAALSIVLKEQDTTLDDVVVVGYGTQKKVNVTGAIATVNAKNLAERANTNILTTVQGQVPGVTIISRPGSTPSINFRGRGSTGGSSNPLYVIDGIISDATFFGRLDPNAIESISFLKDAASSAIYGSRAAYGVVLVTTKSGTKGKLQVDYSGYVGVKHATHRPKMLSADWYVALMAEGSYNDAIRGGSTTAVKPDLTAIRNDYLEKVQTNPNLYGNTNWYNLVLDNDVMTTQHSLSFRGGDDKTRYNSTVGYTLDNSFVPGENTNRYNLATNITSDVTKWMTLRANVKYILNKYKRKGSVSYMDLMVVPATFVAKHTDGTYGTKNNGRNPNSNDYWRNPLRILEQGGWSKTDNGRTNISAGIDLKPFKGLTLTGDMSYYNSDSKEKTFKNAWPELIDYTTKLSIAGTDRFAEMNYDWNETTRAIYNGLASYSAQVAEKHNIGALLGTSFEHTKYQQLKAWRKGFPNNDLTDIEAGSTAEGFHSNNGESYEDKLLSYFGRLTYNFNEKYMFEFNMRADASSRFNEDHRWSYFPSLSAGWRISQEEFMQEVTWLHNLKLRGSWGKLGNIYNVGNYDYFSLYKSGDDYNYNFEDKLASGVASSVPANPSLGWETVTITDIGFDFDILNGKVGMVFDYYNKITDDILIKYYGANEIGVSKQLSGNLGAVRNRGFELAMRYGDKIGNFTFNISGNISKNWNKILDMGPNNNSISDPWISSEGYPIGSFYMYKTDGLYTQEDIDNGNYLRFGRNPIAGDIKYVDVSGPNGVPDGIIDGNDRIVTKCDVPDLTYGIGLNIGYKEFDLAIFSQGVGGVYTYFQNEMVHPFFNYSSPREYHLSRWTEENPDPKSSYPRLYYQSSNQSYNRYQSDFWLFDASYFRIKNISLGYNVPKSLVNKYSLSAVKLYVAVENPFTIIRGDKRMKDFDPETGSGRAQNSRGMQTYTLGVNISF